MIHSVSFKVGTTAQGSPLILKMSTVTVFVGPNNSGKSEALIDLENHIKGVSPLATNPETKIINSIELSSINSQEVDKLIEPYKSLAHYPLPILNDGIKFDERFYASASNPDFNEEQLSKYKTTEHYRATEPYLFKDFVKMRTLRLVGENRLSLLKEQDLGDLSQVIHPDTPNLNILTRLFRENELRERVRKIIFDVTKKYFILDATKLGVVRARLSEKPPASEEEEKSLTNASVSFQASASLIESFSDGIRAFSGIISTLIASRAKVILLDEPETFLHPGLSMKLGKEICQWSKNEGYMRIIASTHSASFLMGCIQSGASVNIIRLTYNNQVATTRILTHDILLHLMRNPLLRSIGILNGLFYDAVVVTEGNSDRAFYQEVNERLLSAEDNRGISNCLFVNAQGKDIIWNIIEPLRKLGIPTAGIVDLDIIKGQIRKLAQSAFMPNTIVDSMTTLGARVLADLEIVAPGGTWKTTGGITLLNGQELEAANHLFEQLESYGIFVVRSGEVESWLNELGVSHEKQNWLRRMFTRFGEDPSQPDYVKPMPESEDVWGFIGRIQEWVNNTTRKGIPE